MTSTRFDVLGIGNAIVDVIARAEEDFLLAQGMRKGGMMLIDEARAHAIYDSMGPAVETSGGSAANTIVGLASFGARTAFVGKIKADGLGRAFSHDIRAAGVSFTTAPATDGPSTGRCYVLVTPDGERTMNTYLGAAQELHPGDIDAAAIAASAVVYLEGYLWDPKNAKDAFLKAAKIAHDIRAAGVAFATPAASNGPSTGRCYVLVTPDGERTMNTYLGAAQNLSPSDIDADTVAASAILYLEGYLWDPKDAKDAFVKAAKIAHEAERKVALSLSDAFCVDRWRAEFLHLMRSHTVDLIFANEGELHSLYQTADFDSAVNALRADVTTAVVTRSEKGCLVIGPDGIEAVSAFPVERVVDTTGAGDLFAAGFLSGVARGADDRTCGRLGALAAAEVIQHLGARPERSLRDLAGENGLG